MTRLAASFFGLVMVVGWSFGQSAISPQIASNDWKGAKAAWRKTKVKDAKDIAAIATEIPKGKKTKELRREVLTKYELVREKGDPDLPGMSDVSPYPVPVVKIEPIIVDTVTLKYLRAVPVSIPAQYFNGRGIRTVQLISFSYQQWLSFLAGGDGLSFVSIDGKPLPFAQVSVTDIVFVVVDNQQFCDALAAWEVKWGIVMDLVGSERVRIIPHPYTDLGQRRTALMLGIERDGWTDANIDAWAQYQADLQVAVARREHFGR